MTYENSVSSETLRTLSAGGPELPFEVALKPFLRFRASRPGLFYDLSTGEFCPLRIPLASSGLRFPPLISREKNGGLPPVTAKRPQNHPLPIALYRALY